MLKIDGQDSLQVRCMPAVVRFKMASRETNSF